MLFIIREYLEHAIVTVLRYVPERLEIAQKILQENEDVSTLYIKLDDLVGGSFSYQAELAGASPPPAVELAIAQDGGMVSDDIAYKARVGDPSVPLDNSQTDLTSAYNNLGDLALRNSGTIVSADLSSTAAIVSGQIADGTIVSADLSATAGILGSQLATAAAIVSGQILDGTIVNADLSTSAAVVGSKLALFTWASSLASLSAANCHVLSGTSGTPTIAATALAISTTFTGQSGAPTAGSAMTTENAFELLAYCSQCVLSGEAVLCFNAWSDVA